MYSSTPTYYCNFNCKFSLDETKKTSENCDSVSLLINKIVENGRELNLEMDAENLVKLINSPNPELTIGELMELKKQSTVEEIEKDFEFRGKIMTVSSLTEGLYLIEAGMTLKKLRKLTLLLQIAPKRA